MTMGWGWGREEDGAASPELSDFTDPDLDPGLIPGPTPIPVPCPVPGPSPCFTAARRIAGK